MIQIENVRFDGVAGYTFDAIIDGQLVNGCRAALGRTTGRLDTIPPQHAAGLDWGEHSLADLSAAARTVINNFGNIPS